jgi:hypothetical protein
MVFFGLIISPAADNPRGQVSGNQQNPKLMFQICQKLSLGFVFMKLVMGNKITHNYRHSCGRIGLDLIPVDTGPWAEGRPVWNHLSARLCSGNPSN